MKNKHCKCRCVVPPSPQLEARIRNTKKALLSESGLQGFNEVDVLDLRTFTLITTRPYKTREHAFHATAARAPVTGTKRAIVLLVDFSDAAGGTSQSHYDDMLFSAGSYASGSMRDYYREVSYNKLDVVGDVIGQGGPTAGWFRAPRTKSYYTDGNFGFNAYPKNAQKCVEDALDLAGTFNFAPYDNDGDGFVEALIIICAGTGGEVTGNPGDFWSHKWNIAPKTVTGAKVDRYFMAPEDGRVGVMAHELGHLLCGLPDLYDTDGSSRGTGRWDLMAGGSWNNGGDTPAHPTAWCKVRCGWVTPKVIFNNSENVTIKPFQDNEDIIKLPIGSTSSQEYFLLSNRRQSKFDAHLPGEGLIIEHVDEGQSTNTNEDHYLVDIEQADGRRDLNLNANSGDATDAYPITGNNEFSDSSSPSSKNYANSNSQVEVKNIQKSGNDITASISVGVTSSSGWVYNKRVLRTFASPHSMNAWAYVEGTGWAKVNANTPDGVTNTFIQLNDAMASNKTISAKIDGGEIHIVYMP